MQDLRDSFQELQLLTESSHNPAAFAKYFLGWDFGINPQQEVWLNKSIRLVNMLKPGNQWGKTTVTAIKHIWHAMYKPNIHRFNLTSEEWRKAEYTTLGFGKTYEVSKAVYDAILDLTSGSVVIKDEREGTTRTNKSRITNAVLNASESPMPEITWWNGSKTLFRSFNDMGSAFKMRRLAYCSGDEVGDIPDLIQFLNVTLMPRIVYYQGTIDLVGTPQNAGDYMDLCEEARKGARDYYLQEGRMDENKSIAQGMIDMLARSGDENYKRRVLYGEFVDAGDKFFPLIDVINAIDPNMRQSPEGWIEYPVSEGRYCLSVDFAASEDNSAFGIVRYDCKPYRLVFLRVFKGNKVPMPMQYTLVRDLMRQLNQKTMHAKLVFDAGSLGGKTAQSFLKELHGFPFPGDKSYPEAKARALGDLKALLEANREIAIDSDGQEYEGNEKWGMLKIPDIRSLKFELEGYHLEDKRIKQDQVMMLAMCVYWIEQHRPRSKYSGAVDFNMMDMAATPISMQSSHANPYGVAQLVKRRHSAVDL